MLITIFDDDISRRDLLMLELNNRPKETRKGQLKDKRPSKTYQTSEVTPRNIEWILTQLLKDYPEKMESVRTFLKDLKPSLIPLNDQEKESIVKKYNRHKGIVLIDIDWREWFNDNYMTAGVELGKILRGVVPIVFLTSHYQDDINEIAKDMGNHFIGPPDSMDIANITKVIDDAYYETPLEAKVKYEMSVGADGDWIKRLEQQKSLMNYKESPFYLGAIVLRNVQERIWRYIDIDDILMFSTYKNETHLYLHSLPHRQPLIIKCTIGVIIKQLEPFWEIPPNPIWNLRCIGASKIVNIKHVEYRTRDYLYFKKSQLYIDLVGSDAVDLDSYMLVLKMGTNRY